jgi:Cu/Ag efflux protein CusF
MQMIKRATCAAALVLLAAALPAAAHDDGPMTTGQVMKIDESAGKLTIKHDPIKHLDMDAMTMVFKPNDPAMLKVVKPGDRVQFHADKVDGQLTVIKIEKAR